ncbi:aconitate hydratase [Anaerosphaera aminiphila DSM 21120]|uniref:Aconitate hydratase n=1 Tax=Anaerosphaera aminiphila DSM 21120 TaxID=1120995 RepID=A0A1M5Q6A8_9FIRM|nr:hydratase [Anaerosphaera aminiphila]SHH09684.1 aconitate hydratase [Anaerosphaera aminiphila DSM 21120]
MIKLTNGSYLVNDRLLDEEEASKKCGDRLNKKLSKKGTMSYKILEKHNVNESSENLKIKFDSLTSHDITYVNIIQTARASGMKYFPKPYVLTNCHNSLCAVGGTINEDDHKFALSAIKKYGGIYVPPNLAVIHSYNREMMTKVGSMILGSDSHTRYGALGTMGIGEGGGELVKQLIGGTYDIKYPEIIAIYLEGSPMQSVGPQDVALNIIKAVYEKKFVKNKILEFIGDGIKNLPIEYRNGIDVMTTEMGCLSSIWQTDEEVGNYYRIHGREKDYKELRPEEFAHYDGAVVVNLSEIKPSIAVPFNPSNVYTIEEFKENTSEIIKKIKLEANELFKNQNINIDLTSNFKDGDFYVDQGIVAGCSGGTYDNIVEMSNILRESSIGNDKFSLNVYPGSQPAYLELVKNGTVSSLMESGVVVKPAFCGPCFGSGDTPENNGFSIRHVTRNFPNREGSKPTEGQISLVALMDARSIAATALNLGKLTGADEIEYSSEVKPYNFNGGIYEKRVLDCYKKPDPSIKLVYGPNIKDWPEFMGLKNNLLVKIAAYITDEVTTTDELIPSGETSAYRSNPERLAEYTLSRRYPSYVENSKKIRDENFNLKNSEKVLEIKKILSRDIGDLDLNELVYGSGIYANSIGEGSAREQAASNQKVLGGVANFAKNYATKRYRSNLINWGIIPFIAEEYEKFKEGNYIYIPNIKQSVLLGEKSIKAYVISENNTLEEIFLGLDFLTDIERETLVAGSLINLNKNNN